MKRILRTLAVVAASAVLGFGLLSQSGHAASTLSTSVQVTIKPVLTGTVGLAALTSTAQATQTFTMLTGTGASQGDVVYTATASIASAGTLSLDLQGSLVQADGSPFTPAKLRLVYIYDQSGNTTNLTLFGDAASVPILNTAATTTTLTPGDFFLVTRKAAAGITVTPTTGDIIKIVNGSGATALVDIILVGTSA